MPLFSSKLELTSAASGSGIAIADVDFIRGAFRTIANTGALNNIPVTQTSNGQIVWVEGESATYQATVTPADYVNTFEDTVSWSVFTGFGSGGGGSVDFSTTSTDLHSNNAGATLTVDSELSYVGGEYISITYPLDMTNVQIAIVTAYSGTQLTFSHVSNNGNLLNSNGPWIINLSGAPAPTVYDYTALSNIPNGIVSSSAQITSAISSGDLDMDGNKVLFSNVYSQLADLPSASKYHGMFAHVHATGKAYFAHGGNWVELANAGSGGDITSVIAGSGLSGGDTSGDVTISLDTGSSHFIDAIAELSNSGIFSQTGSFYSTNNNIEINGSLELKYEGKDNPFTISSGSTELIRVNNQGVLVFTSQTKTPSEIDGGMYRDINGNFFLGM